MASQGNPPASAVSTTPDMMHVNQSQHSGHDEIELAQSITNTIYHDNASAADVHADNDLHVSFNPRSIQYEALNLYFIDGIKGRFARE
jgi:hypothetical protein